MLEHSQQKMTVPSDTTALFASPREIAEGPMSMQVYGLRKDAGSISGGFHRFDSSAISYLPDMPFDESNKTASDDLAKNGKNGITDGEAAVIADLLKDGKVQGETETKTLSSLFSKTSVKDLDKINSLMEKDGFKLKFTLANKTFGQRPVRAPGYDLVNTTTNLHTRIYTPPSSNALTNR